ncbi:hypothetical protein [Convivina intestini]|uniref:hypothetical protein n=1 Tax=Convivina intestini TaxID=1505726 RepID=UPI00200BD0DC|nr:hypothetical protein [Convivina intestini]CAH1853912.1 hypothetical protein R078131_00865 [Convivina intestini]
MLEKITELYYLNDDNSPAYILTLGNPRAALISGKLHVTIFGAKLNTEYKLFINSRTVDGYEVTELRQLNINTSELTVDSESMLDNNSFILNASFDIPIEVITTGNTCITNLSLTKNNEELDSSQTYNIVKLVPNVKPGPMMSDFK